MNKSISRRRLLQGAGAAIGLPLLDAMVSGCSRAAAVPPARLVIVYAPSGMIMQNWTPDETGKSFIFPRTLKPLERHRENVLVLSGLAAHNGNALGDGPGDHARAASAYLTGTHPRKTEGADIHCGVSMDQIAAKHTASLVRIPSLEITCEDSRQIGACDSYSCVYQSISWKSETQPMPPEMNPRVVFERLFGDAQASPAKREVRRSVLDLALGQTRSLEREVGPADRRKLDEYFTSIREVETRIDRAQPVPAGVEEPAGIPTSYREHARLMFDLTVLALASDATRTITFMLAREGGLQTYPEAGVPEAHHSCSHHRNQPDLIEKVSKINEFHVAQFAYFLDRMKATRDGDGSLLDRSAVVYGAALGDPNVHDHDNLPTVLVGANRRIGAGRHIRFAAGTPISNLHLTLLDFAGVPINRLGDSTGKLDPLTGL